MEYDLTCAVCKREVRNVVRWNRECSHVECPNRRTAWSERPTKADLHRGPWQTYEENDPLPIDVELKLKGIAQ